MKNKTKKISWDLLPLLMVTAALPLVAMGRKVSVSLGKYSWFADGNYQYDFFMYAKSIVFLILVAWMLIVLIDRGLIRGIKLKHWKLFIPLYIYGLMVLISTVFSADRELSLKGMWQQYESVWILLGYLITAFYCVQVVQSLQDIRVLCISGAVGAAVQGILGISQFIGRDLFASEIGRNFLALGMDSSTFRTIRFVYEGNSRSSVYMASYTPNYAGMYLVMVLPVLFVLALQAKKNRIQNFVDMPDRYITCLLIWNRIKSRIPCVRISGSSCYHPDGTEASYKKEMDICRYMYSGSSGNHGRI